MEGRIINTSNLVYSPYNTQERDSRGNSCLHLALGAVGNSPYSPDVIITDIFSDVKLLIDNGIDINAADNNGITPLMIAVTLSNEDFISERSFLKFQELISILILRGASVYATDKRGATALFYAAYAGNVNAVKLLIDAGSDINAIDKNGATAFKYSIENKHLHAAKLLAQYQLDVSIAHENSVLIKKLEDENIEKDLPHPLIMVLNRPKKISVNKDLKKTAIKKVFTSCESNQIISLNYLLSLKKKDDCYLYTDCDLAVKHLLNDYRDSIIMLEYQIPDEEQQNLAAILHETQGSVNGNPESFCTSNQVKPNDVLNIANYAGYWKFSQHSRNGKYEIVSKFFPCGENFKQAYTIEYEKSPSEIIQVHTSNYSSMVSPSLYKPLLPKIKDKEEQCAYRLDN